MGRFVGAENVDRGRDYLEQLDPELHRYIIDFVYGEVYAGEVLDPKTRALCTVSMLAALDQQLQLGVYVQGLAARAPSRRRSVKFCARSPYTPAFRVAWNALATMKAALERFDDEREARS